jgi:hypothetical protein
VTRAPFSPEPFTPGAPIEWAQIAGDGTEVRRAGVVWCLAPICHASTTVWAIPDDGGAVVAVVKMRARSKKHAGRYWPDRASVTGSKWSPAGGRRILAGETFSEDCALTETGALTGCARKHSARMAEMAKATA